MLRKIRIILAILFLSLITLLFLDFTGVVGHWFAWMARIQFLPALLAINVGVVVGMLALTLIFGRFYCSIICPLGVMQDFFSWLGGKCRKNRFRFHKENPWLRYGVLLLFVLLMLFGLHSIALLIAPYSAYGRIVSQLFAPLYTLGNNFLSSVSEHYGNYAFYRREIIWTSLPTLIIASVTFVLLAVSSFLGGRVWCSNLCPVGSLLGFVSRFSLLKPSIDVSKCVHCGLCEKNCKASCIHSAEQKIDYSRCVGCMDCLEQCHSDAIRYRRPKYRPSVVGNAEQPDASKRDFLTVSALVAGGLTLKSAGLKVDGGLAVIEDKKVPQRAVPVRPAGSLGLRHFENHCTACQLCVSSCPNRVLRPSSELSRLMQPEMSFEKGYCRPECVRCSKVCPTHAIRKIDREEKSSIQIGHAVWIEKNCLIRTEAVSCDQCMRHCPTGAISLVAPDKGFGLKVPVIDTEKCIGCGACENLCPARPFSAIYVEGHELHRTL